MSDLFQDEVSKSPYYIIGVITAIVDDNCCLYKTNEAKVNEIKIMILEWDEHRNKGEKR